MIWDMPAPPWLQALLPGCVVVVVVVVVVDEIVLPVGADIVLYPTGLVVAGSGAVVAGAAAVAAVDAVVPAGLAADTAGFFGRPPLSSGLDTAELHASSRCAE